jgi:IclR family transcriptional regulator, acetate operon repressor
MTGFDPAVDTAGFAHAPEPGGQGTGPPAGADRVLATLRRLGSHPEGARLNELARSLHSPKSSVHRALRALQRADMVEQDDEGRYRLGYGFLQLAFNYYEHLDDVERIRPVLAELADYFGETAHYAVLRGCEVVYVAKVQSPRSQVHLTSVIGGRNPAHCTGVGKVLLAHRLADREAVSRFVARTGPLERRTERTLVSATQLHNDFKAIRARGFGTDQEESERGVNCVALPVFLASHTTPAGAISITALAQRNPVDRLVASLEGATRIIQARLGEDVVRSVIDGA